MEVANDGKCFHYQIGTYGFCSNCDGKNEGCQLYLTKKEVQDHNFYLNNEKVRLGINKIGRLESLEGEVTR